MNNLTLSDKLRTGHVKRWQIVRVAREQTIAEHMYRTFLISMDVAKVLRFSPERKLLVASWALMHDIPEVVTGDLNTPIKAAMRSAVPDSDPIKHIELSLDSEYSDFYINIKEHHPIVIDVVKLADMMEAVNFLIAEGMGPHAAEVQMGIRKNWFNHLVSCSEKYGHEFDMMTIYPMWDEICPCKSGDN